MAKAWYQTPDMEEPVIVEVQQWLWIGFSHTGTVAAMTICEGKFKMIEENWLEPLEKDIG